MSFKDYEINDDDLIYHYWSPTKMCKPNKRYNKVKLKIGGKTHEVEFNDLLLNFNPSMSYKVGDRIKITKENIFGDSCVGQEGEIIEIEDNCAFGVPIKVKVVDDGFEEIVYTNEDSIEKVSPTKSTSQKTDQSWKNTMDNILDNRDGPNVSQQNCRHEFIMVGQGLYGDYWNCKHCDMKKEDWIAAGGKEEDLKPKRNSWWDIPF